MGYGIGATLLAVGLILALAVSDVIDGVDLTAAGWIMALVGVLLLALTAITANRRGTVGSTMTTTDAAGGQTTTDRRSEI